MPAESSPSITNLRGTLDQAANPDELSVTPRRIQVQRRPVTPSRSDLPGDGGLIFEVMQVDHRSPLSASARPVDSTGGPSVVLHTTNGPSGQRGLHTSHTHSPGATPPPYHRQDNVAVPSPVNADELYIYSPNPIKGIVRNDDEHSRHQPTRLHLSTSWPGVRKPFRSTWTEVEAAQLNLGPQWVKRSLLQTLQDPSVPIDTVVLVPSEHRGRRSRSLNPTPRRGREQANESPPKDVATAVHRGWRSRSLNSSLRLPGTPPSQRSGRHGAEPTTTPLTPGSQQRHERQGCTAMHSPVGDETPKATFKGGDAFIEQQHPKPSDSWQRSDDNSHLHRLHLDDPRQLTPQRSRVVPAAIRSADGAWTSAAAFPAPMEGYLAYAALPPYPEPPRTPQRLAATPTRRARSPVPGMPPSRTHLPPTSAPWDFEKRSHSANPTAAPDAARWDHARARSSSPGRPPAVPRAFGPRTFGTPTKGVPRSSPLRSSPSTTPRKSPTASSASRDRFNAVAGVALARAFRPSQLVSKATQTEQAVKKVPRPKVAARAPPSGRDIGAANLTAYSTPEPPRPPPIWRETTWETPEVAPMTPLQARSGFTPPRPTPLTPLRALPREAHPREQSPPPYQPISPPYQPPAEKAQRTSRPTAAAPAASRAGWLESPQSTVGNADRRVYPVVRTGTSPARPERPDEGFSTGEASRQRLSYRSAGVKSPRNPDGSLWFPQVRSVTGGPLSTGKTRSIDAESLPTLPPPEADDCKALEDTHG